MYINLAQVYLSQERKKSVLKKISLTSGLLLVLQLSFSSLMPITIQATPVEATGICNLIITKSVDKASALPGDILKYTINYRNAGTKVCTGGGVQVFDTLNSNLTYLANSRTIVITGDSEADGYTAGNNYNGHGNDLLYNVNRVSPGESGVVILQATVGAYAGCGNYQIPNKGKIWSDQTSYLLSDQVITNINLPCPYCGDNIKQSPNQTGTGGPLNDGYEACDGVDGVGEHQSCSASCTLINLPYCGDGIKNNTEECDGTDGVGANQSCSQTCTLTNLPFCGNGVIDSGETCDDGNTSSNDGCSATCQTEGGGEPKGSLKICKYKDADGLASTTNDRVIINDWNFTISRDSASSSQATLTDGCTVFSSLNPGEYSVSEELKAGWSYFEPANGQATSTIVANVQTEINFYNYRNTYCGDGIKQTPNETLLGGPANNGLEACDGTDGVGEHQSCSSTCTLTDLPFCGDGTCNNQETCSSCSQDCGGCGGGGGGGGGSFITTLTFNNLGSASNLCSTVLVNWSTSQFATSRVIYDTVSQPDLTGQSAPNYGYASATVLDGSPVTGHSVTLTGLTPGLRYYLRPVSAATQEKVGSEISILVNANCGEVLAVKIQAPAPTKKVLGLKILPNTGFNLNELLILILALGSLIFLRLAVKKAILIKKII